MDLLPEALIHCPYCGEPVTVLIDPSVDEQEYIEDCAVCCQPMTLRATADPDGAARVEARRDDE